MCQEEIDPSKPQQVSGNACTESEESNISRCFWPGMDICLESVIDTCL